MARSRDSQRRLKRGLPSFEEEREMRRRRNRRRRSRQKRRRQNPPHCIVCLGGKELGPLIMACDCKYRTGWGLGPNMAKYHFFCLKDRILGTNDAPCTGCNTEFSDPRITRWRKYMAAPNGTIYEYKRIRFGAHVYDGKYYPDQVWLMDVVIGMGEGPVVEVPGFDLWAKKEPDFDEWGNEESSDEEPEFDEWGNLIWGDEEESSEEEWFDEEWGDQEFEKGFDIGERRRG